MGWDALDDEALGRAVDAWLTAFRAHGMSGRRLDQVAGLRGDAMGDDGPQTAEQLRCWRPLQCGGDTIDGRTFIIAQATP